MARQKSEYAGITPTTLRVPEELKCRVYGLREKGLKVTLQSLAIVGLTAEIVKLERMLEATKATERWKP